MSRPGQVLRALVCAATIAAAGCGGDEGRATPAPRPAKPLSASICSPVAYGGPGRPQYLIVSHAGFQGVYKGHGVQTAQAIKMVLGQRDWRAGPYTVGMQACEETSAKTGQPSPEKCARNARALAENESVLGVIGPLTSFCATHMLATLNKAPGGPLATISGGNSYVGLTRSGPGTAPGEPERYHPTGRRGYARLAPSDDVQGAANALFAQRNGARRAFVLQDGGPYGRGLAAAFELAARELGLDVAGTARWDAEADGYRALAERIRASRADTLFISGDISANGQKLVADLTKGLDRDVQLMAGDAFNQPETLVEAAGAGVEGMVISIAVLPNRKLSPEGRRFADEFTRRFRQRPCCFSVHDAQATMMLLDAIARSGGSRARVAEAVMTAEVPNGLIGDFAIDRNGDTTLTAMGIYRIRRGRIRFETVITPAPELLARD
jgi:branched-chain amino acid transport system substrate-binding protein